MVPGRGPCGRPSTTMPQAPQIPSRQSLSKATGGSPAAASSSLSRSRTSRRVISGRTSVERVADEAAGLPRIALPPDPERDLHDGLTRTTARAGRARRSGAAPPGARAHGPSCAGHPGRDMGEARVVAERLAVGRLVLLPEVAAAGLLARERVAAHQLAQLEEVGHPARPLQLLVELGRLAGDARGPPRTPRAAPPPRRSPSPAPRGSARARMAPRAGGPARGGNRPRYAGRRWRAAASSRACTWASASRAPRARPRPPLASARAGQVAGQRVGQDEVAVGQALHERARPQPIGAVIGEVRLADHEQPGRSAHEVVVHPEPAHGVVRGGRDAHRRRGADRRR